MSETREAMIRRAVTAMQESKAWPAVFRPETGRTLAEAAVDAAAAPDLAEALEDVLDALGALSNPSELYGHGFSDEDAARILGALARAKGAS